MIDLSIEKYLETLSFIDNKIVEMRNFLLNKDLDSIRLINILIETNYKLIEYNFEYLNILESNVFSNLFISCIKSGYIASRISLPFTDNIELFTYSFLLLS